MTGIAIVAIPAQDDYVWKISTEKVPHMTLLFLGEITPGPELARIETFLAHVVSTSAYRFGMSVDRRDKLGPDSADVLIFRKDHDKMIEAVRSDLLKNSDIRNAYNSTTQYPEWTPHLTLGYPATPAKPDNRDYPGFGWVAFDKIALWIGNYDGPEFRLEDKEEMDLAMSTDFAADILQHHGVKGMKWGVRNDKGHEGERTKTRKIAKLDKKYDKSLQGMNGFIKVNNAVAARINPRLDVLNAKPQYQVDMRKNPKVHAQYLNEYKQNLEKAVNEAMSDIGTNASGTQRIHLIVTGKGENTSYEGYTEVLKHADQTSNFVIVLKFNVKGQVVDQSFEPTADVLTQGLFVVEDILNHSGVKGMKWGVRKDGSTSSTSTTTSRFRRPATDVVAKQKPGQFVRTSGGKKQIATDDAVKTAASRQLAKKSTTDTLSNKQLQDAVTRMNLEQQFHTLVKKTDRQTRGQRFVQKLIGGKKVLDKNGNPLPNTGPSAASQAAGMVAGVLKRKANG